MFYMQLKINSYFCALKHKNKPNERWQQQNVLNAHWYPYTIKTD